MEQLLSAILILFGASILIIPLCQKLRVPSVIGFLVTGLLAGPNVLGLIRTTESVNGMADLGVVFLMFLVGMDFTVDHFNRLKRTMLLGGAAQTVMTFALFFALIFIGLFSFSKGMMLAFILIQSSTSIALKIYQERNEMHAPQTEISVGISLFQDITTVLLLIAIPMLAMEGVFNTAFASFLQTGLKLVMMAAVFAAVSFLLPYVLRFIIGTGINELTILTAVFLCLGAARISSLFGFSPALGAFVCGVILSRGGYHEEFASETSPFKDIFLSLFFISIGMLLDWRFCLDHSAAILALTVAAVVAKSVILYASTRVLGYPFRTAFMTGIGISNIGEFGLILLRASAPYGMFSTAEYQAVSAVAILSMFSTPLLIHAGTRLMDYRAARDRKDAPSPQKSAADSPGEKVIIVGFGMAGRQLAGVLKAAAIPYIVIESHGRVAQEAKSAGEPVLFGDASRRDILVRAGIETAHAVVFVISDPGALRNAVKAARQLNPGLFIVTRTRKKNEIESLLSTGADEVVSEEFETSIELFTILLTRLHVPRNLIRAQTRLLRGNVYQMLRVPQPAGGIPPKVMQALSEGTTETFFVSDGHFALRKSLKELALRSVTGAMIIAVVRGEKSMTNPPADFVLETGDTLVMVGNHAQIDAAFEFLETGQRDRRDY